MEETKKKELSVNGFAPVLWKSRRRSVKNAGKAVDDAVADKSMEGEKTLSSSLDNSNPDKSPERKQKTITVDMQQEPSSLSNLSEKRKALFEPLEPVANINGKRPSAELLLPPPDFESASYPRGWLIGKKRKLVNVDVVETMRRIAIQEMNQKVLLWNNEFCSSSFLHHELVHVQDREIDGLNEQLEEDARCLEHLQLQLLEERSKRAEMERQSTLLQNQVTMLMDMLQENEAVEDDRTMD